jgi:hypothetical protein
LVAAIRQNVISLPDSVGGRQLMMIFKYQRTALFDPDYLEATERIYRTHKELSHKRRGGS